MKNHEPLIGSEIFEKLSSVNVINSILGDNTNTWNIQELKGGNLNQVDVIKSEKGSVCVKQSLPYLRILGPDSKMPLDRILYENHAIKSHSLYTPNLIPNIFYFNSSLYLMVMEYFEDYLELRKLLHTAKTCDFLARDIGHYLAHTIFLSSDLSLKPKERRLEAAKMAGNWGMYKWMEELSYTDPYIKQPRNSWNSPYLDKIAHEFRNDGVLKINVSILKEKYMSDHACLVHGDFHTDSILVGKNDIKIIDFEHAFYGPFGYDFGHLYGHLLLNYFSLKEYKNTEFTENNFDVWILKTIYETWQYFVNNFNLLWETRRTGEAYSVKLFENSENKKFSNTAKEIIIQRTLENAIGFTGIEMVRRILTVGQVNDLERITSPEKRSRSEILCLKLGRNLIINFKEFKNISQLIDMAQNLFHEEVL